MRNILLSSAGSKVALARIVALSARKRGATFFATDENENAPTRHFADVFETIDTSSSLDALLDYCSDQAIGLVIPSRHSTLKAFAKAKPRFQERGIQIGVSSVDSIEMCINKLNTFEHFTRSGIPTPKTFALDPESPELIVPQLPLIAKPVYGSGSDRVHFVDKIETIAQLASSEEFLAQAIAPGIEYTINAYVSKDGRCLCEIPHRRIAVENGESMQATTERIPALAHLAQTIVEATPGLWGPINIQAFYDPESESALAIEINPRIGGGYPLADKAKGEFIEWLIQETLEDRALEAFDSWTSGLRMLRFRESVFDFPSH